MIENAAILITALLPVAILLFYIGRKDKLSPEPAGQLVKAFLLGVTSVFLSLFLSVPCGELGLYPEECVTVFDAILTSFFAAAIPEEAAKLFVLWLLLRRNTYFDERMDGIVYAVSISLGFAALENIFYLFSEPESYLSTGISRALFSIPGHFGFGVLMGYYYSLAKFDPIKQKKNAILTMVAPVLAHGIYDSILFTIEVSPALSGILTILFLFFCHRMWKSGSRRIAEHISHDRELSAADLES